MDGDAPRPQPTYLQGLREFIEQTREASKALSRHDFIAVLEAVERRCTSNLTTAEIDAIIACAEDALDEWRVDVRYLLADKHQDDLQRNPPWARLVRGLIVKPHEAQLIAELGRLSNLHNLSSLGIHDFKDHAATGMLSNLADATGLSVGELSITRCEPSTQQVLFSTYETLREAHGFNKMRALPPICLPPTSIEGWDAVFQAPQFQGLTHLYLNNNALEDRDIEGLASACMTKLFYLNLEENNIGPSGFQALGHSTVLRCLKQITVRHNPIGDEGIRAFLEGGPFENLDLIDLTYTLISDQSAIDLSQNKVLPPFATLDLSKNMLTDEGLLVLCRQARFAPDGWLYMKHSGLTSEGIGAAFSQPLSEGLSKLVVSNNALGDDGAFKLAASPHARQLSVLFIESCGLTPDGIEALEQSPHLRECSIFTWEPM